MADDLIYISDFSGYLHCLDANTGQPYWVHDTFASIWGSPFVADGKVYLADEDGDIVVLEHGKELKGPGGNEHGQRRLRHARSRPRHPVPEQPQRTVRARRAVSIGKRTLDRMKQLLPILLVAAMAVRLAGQTPVNSPASSPESSNEWRQFRGNHSLTGVADSAPPANLKLLWTYETGDSIESSAAIADGIVYVGVGNGDLIAVDLDSGALRWKYSTQSYIGESSPAVGSGAVYVGDLDGTLHAVSARDGKPLWTFKTDAEIKSSPVLVPVPEDDLVLIGSYDTHLYALEARTGKLRWKYQTDGPVHATPAVHNGFAFIAGCDETFRAIRVSDGTQAYAIVAGAYTGASPVLDGDRAYFGTFNFEVLALDLKAQKVAWRYSDPAGQFPYYSSAALSGGKVIVGGRDKLVHAIDAATGKPAWTFTTRARVDSSPVVAGGRVYIGSADNRLYVLDLASGRKLWEFDTGASITASPAVAAGRVVIGSHDGVLYCFG